MKQPLLTVVLLVLMLLIYSLADAQKGTGHFFDVQGKPLAQYDSLFGKLSEYFENSVPEIITVVYTSGITSRFDIRDERVLINEAAAKLKPYQVIGHESSHLSMANFTKGASVEEQFRFFDEGFATIFENILDHRENEYKESALKYAAVQNQQSNLSFEKVQKWGEYFGHPPAANWKAYDVGASFVYYVIDTYGKDSFLAFCKDTGDTRNLSQSCQHIFRKEQSTIEAEWRQYLNKVAVSTAPPRIVKMFPENQATQVGVKTVEIYVEFDVPMDEFICVYYNKNGVSYKNAHWKTNKILALKVNLLPNHHYLIPLGRPSGHKFMSSDYVELTPVEWEFTTGSE